MSNSKKEKILIRKEINKFELNPDDSIIDKEKIKKDKAYSFEKMCYKDTNQLNLIYNLGYANKINIYELKNMIEIYCKRIIDIIS